MDPERKPHPASFNVSLGGVTDHDEPGANAEASRRINSATAEQNAHTAKWSRRARRFIVVTAAFNLFMGILAVVAGAIVQSSACLAYGLESFVDVAASAIATWRFWNEGDNVKDLAINLGREERANVGIAATFILVAIITGGNAISHLTKHTPPGNSTPILACAAFSVVVLTAFAAVRRSINKRLASKAMEQDMVVCLSTVVLSIGILITAALYRTSHEIWWLDAAFAITVTVFMALYSIPILLTRPWWRKQFWEPWETDRDDQGQRLRTQPDSSF